MPSKTLTLRITDEKTIEAIEFIRREGGFRTDSKAIISAVDTFEEDHWEMLRLKDRVEKLENTLGALEEAYRDKRLAEQEINSILGEVS